MSPRFGRGRPGEEPAGAGSRSADERERARREREARRVAREGRAAGAGPSPAAAAAAPAPPPAGIPGEPPPVPAPAPPPVLAPDPRSGPSPAPPVSDAVPPAVPSSPAPAPPVPDADPPAMPSSADPPPVPDADPPAVPSSAAPAVASPEPPSLPPAPDHDATEDWMAEDEPAVVVRGRQDGPSGVKRVRGSQLASAAGAEGPPRFGAPPRGRPRARRGMRRALLLLPLLLVAAIAVFALELFQPLGDGKGKGRVAVTIPSGLSAGQIGTLLAHRGVVAHGGLFSLRARLSGQRGDLRSGTFTLARDMHYDTALAALTKRLPPAPRTIKVVFPEGKSRREAAAIVKRAGLRGSYLKATAGSPRLRPHTYGAPSGTRTLEGFLFPATYDVRPGSSAASLVRQQLATFRQRFATIDMGYARRKHLSRYDVLTIASMIEREAEVPKDRPLIAAVIYNRLADGMPLGIDATIRYRLNNWTRPLTQSELDIDSPYNTRRVTGLPPTPIGSPGLASIRAAARPAKVKYVYYVVKPCGDGAHAFSATDAGFQRDVAAYDAARAKRGGKDPSHC